MIKIDNISHGRDNTVYIDMITREGNISIAGTLRLDQTQAISFAYEILEKANTTEEPDSLPF